jgi:release factor glutamine methyltransferase
MTTVVEILKKTEAFFRSKGIASPRLDAELIVGHHLGLDRMALYLKFDRPVNEAELGPMRNDVKRRANREPVAWIVGTKGFWTLDLESHPDVLVPRPDSETLVEAALARIPEDEPCFVADIGCGTGAIGLAIASERPLVKLFCVDISDAALHCTKANVAKLEFSDRVAVLKGSLLDPIPTERRIDVVVSNPPYIPTADIDGLAPEISTHEPRTALDGGADGLDIYRTLIPAAAARAQIAVLVEHGDGQHEAVQAMMTEAGLTGLETHCDLTSTVRAVSGLANNDD